MKFLYFILSLTVSLILVAVYIGFGNIITNESFLGKWTFISNNVDNNQKENVFFGKKDFFDIKLDFSKDNILKISDNSEIYHYNIENSKTFKIIDKNNYIEEYNIFTEFKNNNNQDCFTLKKIKSIHKEQTNGIICKN